MSSPSPSVNSSMKGSKAVDVSDPLYQVKLLASLRSGDTAAIQSFLTDLSRVSSKGSTVFNAEEQAATALHLAVRCAPVDILQLMLGHRTIDPNACHPPGSKTTALHLASSLGRADVVELLLEQKDIDDTARDDKGQTCKDVARGKEVLVVIQDSQALLQDSFKSLLRSYIASPSNTAPPPALLDLLNSPRVKILDISALDDVSGTTLLHEAARRKDLRLVERAVQGGADVFARDRRGKTVGEGVGKDDRVKAFLRQFANQDTTLLDGPATVAPVLKGSLNKYTNVAKGYNSRWFVLKDGVLSYYRRREEEDVASRGSIAMISATVRVHSGHDKHRFEVQSHPNASKNTTAQRWWIKANQPGEASRWVHAIQRSIEWAQNRAKENKEATESIVTRPSTLRTKLSKRGSISGQSMASSHINIGGVSDGEDRLIGDPGSSKTSFSQGSREDEPPHSASYELHANAVSAQVELIHQLLESFSTSLQPMPSPKTLESKKAMKESLSSLQDMITQHQAMSRERDQWWSDRLEQEKDRAVVWEESLNVVVREGEVLERELRNTIREKRAGRKRSTAAATATEVTSSWGVESSGTEQFHDLKDSTCTTFTTAPTSIITAPSEKDLPIPPAKMDSATPVPQMHIDLPPPTIGVSEGPDTDEEDEFFDAIESNTLPNLEMSSVLSRKAESTELPTFLDMSQYEAYNHLRKRLPIGADERPAISLWTVLKNNIGKDLTKISFPVTFNEPTSMLQRMAEDMEFSECLDAAAADEDPHKRIAFVAAFAMSNYSSTIGRIAKPFNPMLGETFEYVRVDGRYRYMSEQVCHHPPISACWSESPSWHYFGEVDAQNKFMGKSFEIRPTGVAHAELLLPEKWGPDYPAASGAQNAGKVVEHYTWKKVTTNVSGFIIGSPTIDHYGEMRVVNHRTKDTCILTFKPRGWRGRDAYEITGRVMDAKGHVAYEIAGRWNSQLVARQVGTGIGDLLPDVEVPGGAMSPASPSIPRYILLWRNTDKPKSPFNLTPYAITLNDAPGDLSVHLCPTDCRLRPDQRAFESGKYELANELKIQQEEFQRATRRKREAGIVPPHRPRWFNATKDRDTGERVWEPIRAGEGEPLDYWTTRERLWREAGGVGKEKLSWPDVDQIFIDADID